jgi:hypothetical protein
MLATIIIQSLLYLIYLENANTDIAKSNNDKNQSKGRVRMSQHIFLDI